MLFGQGPGLETAKDMLLRNCRKYMAAAHTAIIRDRRASSAQLLAQQSLPSDVFGLCIEAA